MARKLNSRIFGVEQGSFFGVLSFSVPLSSLTNLGGTVNEAQKTGFENNVGDCGASWQNRKTRLARSSRSSQRGSGKAITAVVGKPSSNLNAVTEDALGRELFPSTIQYSLLIHNDSLARTFLPLVHSSL